MEKNENLIGELNNRLDEELAAVYQYMVHAEMCENLQFKHLSHIIQKRAFVKMWHAKILIAHILSIGGIPKTDRQSHFTFSAKVQDLDISAMHEYDLKTEEKAIEGYNNSIRVATETENNDTKVLLESLLKEDVALKNWIKAQIVQIEKMGIVNYLSQQIFRLYNEHAGDGGDAGPDEPRGPGEPGGSGACPGCHFYSSTFNQKLRR